MKKLFLSFLFTSFSLLVFSQQNAFRPEWSFGVNGGSTLSRIRFTPRVSQEYLIQYHVGATARYISEEHFGIQAELNYSLRGWKDLTDDVFLNEYDRSLVYLELPLMTHLYFDLSKRVRFLFLAGPQIAYLLDEKWNLTLNDPEENIGYYDLPVQRKFDYGIVLGGGLEFRTGIGSFVLDGRYYFGLSDIFNNTRADIFSASSNQVIGINLTYLTKFH